MLPLGGLLVSIYAGWVLPARIRNAELSDLNGFWSGTWLFLVRVVAPVLVIIVLLDKIGLINVDEISYQLMH
jgi:NSS family neurotransmitter:Na+ symporter